MARPESGFTLIEVLVAFSIAAMSLALLLRIHSNSTATVVMAEEYGMATELAQSLVDEHSVTAATLEFVRTGRFSDKFVWTVRADEYARPVPARPDRDVVSADGGADADPPFLLREITVDVSWPSRTRSERIEVRTIRPYLLNERRAGAFNPDFHERPTYMADVYDNLR